MMVKDISSDGGSGDPSYLVTIGNTLYFRANDGIHGTELWKSDGTADGTVMVKDISSDGDGDPYDLVAIGNRLYFIANDGTMDMNYGKVMGQQMEL
jgi:trimeric autotransporter adhesin